MANLPAFFFSHQETCAFKIGSKTFSVAQSSYSPLSFFSPPFSFPSVASSAMIDSLEEGEGCVRAHISSPLSGTKASLSRELNHRRTSDSLEREYFSLLFHV